MWHRRNRLCHISECFAVSANVSWLGPQSIGREGSEGRQLLENFHDCRRDDGEVERLLDHEINAGGDLLHARGRGHEDDDGTCGRPLRESLEKRAAVESGHHQVEQDQTARVGRGIENFQRLETVSGTGDVDADASQGRRQQLSDRWLIFHNQHSRHAAILAATMPGLCRFRQAG